MIWRWPASINRLLVYWLVACLPVAVAIAVLWNGMAGAGLILVSWYGLRFANRAAWKRHFRPRATR